MVSILTVATTIAQLGQLIGETAVALDKAKAGTLTDEDWAALKTKLDQANADWESAG